MAYTIAQISPVGQAVVVYFVIYGIFVAAAVLALISLAEYRKTKKLIPLLWSILWLFVVTGGIVGTVIDLWYRFSRSRN